MVIILKALVVYTKVPIAPRTAMIKAVEANISLPRIE